MPGPSQGAWPRRVLLALTALLGLHLPLTGSPAGAAVDKGAPLLVAAGGEQRPLLEQKLKLLKAYITSTATKVEASGDESAKEALATARQQYEAAEAALEADDPAAASAALDNGLKAVSAASARMAGSRKPRRDIEKDAASYHRLKGQIESYLQTVTAALATDGRGPEVSDPLKRIDSLMVEAGKEADARRYDTASRTLRNAYELTVTLVSGLRKGQTVISRLHFETPADELEYERRRNGSYEMLVQLMIEDLAPTRANLRPRAERRIAASQELRARAEAEAEKGELEAAITTMEAATRELVRALQEGGLPVFE